MAAFPLASLRRRHALPEHFAAATFIRPRSAPDPRPCPATGRPHLRASWHIGPDGQLRCAWHAASSPPHALG